MATLDENTNFESKDTEDTNYKAYINGLNSALLNMKGESISDSLKDVLKICDERNIQVEKLDDVLAIIYALRGNYMPSIIPCSTMP